MARQKRGLTKGIGIGLVCLFIAGTALAVPLLALLIEPAAVFVGGLVIRTVARQAVLTVGVAANDASWIAPLAGLVSRAAAILRIAGSVNSYELPLQPDVPVPAPAVDIPGPSGTAGSFENPLSFRDSRIRYQVSSNKIIDAVSATDGVIHYFPAGVYTVDEICAKYTEIFGMFWKPGPADEYGTMFHIVSDPEMAPWLDGRRGEFVIGGVTYYVQPWMLYRGNTTPSGGSWTFPGGAISVKIAEARDNVKRFVRTTTGFKPDAMDPDWTASELEAHAEGGAVKFLDSNQSVVLVSGNETATQIKAAAQTDLDVKYRVVELSPTGMPTSVKEAVVKNASAGDVVLSFDPLPVTDPGTGTGTGTGGGSCGGTGQPPCAVNDDGFGSQSRTWEHIPGVDMDIEKKSIDENYEAPNFDWAALRPSLLPGSPIGCQPLVFRGYVQKYGLDAETSFDPCWIFELIRGLLGYLFMVTTAVYVWNKFLGTADAGRGKGK